MTMILKRPRLPGAMVVAIALALISCVGADRQARNWTAIGHAGWPQFQCDRANSIPLNAEEFLHTPENYSGQCVYARGYTQSGRFYGTLEGLYGYLGRTPELNFENEIGLDTFDPEIENIVNGRHFVELVAFAETCGEVSNQQFEDAEAENILLFPMSGWCHSSSGPVLFIAQLQEIDDTALRLYDPEAARQYGNIVDMEEGWADAEEAQRIIAGWYEAVRVRDSGRLNIRYEEDVSMLTGTDSPLAFLFNAPEIPPIKYLRVAGQFDEAFLEDSWSEVPGLGAYGCLCKTEDCEGKWPIISDDALTEGPWPYYCILIWQTRDDEGGVDTVIHYPSTRRLY